MGDRRKPAGLEILWCFLTQISVECIRRFRCEGLFFGKFIGLNFKWEIAAYDVVREKYAFWPCQWEMSDKDSKVNLE